MSDVNGVDRDEDARGAHVLHVADRDVFMRFGQMLRQLFLGLADADVTVSVLTDDAASAERFIPPSATVQGVPALSGWKSWLLSGHLSHLTDEPPALVHVWGMRSAASVGRWARRSGVPMLVHALSTEDVLALNRRGVRPDQYVAGACDSFCRALGARRPVSQFPIQRLTPGILIPDIDSPDRRDHRTIGVVCVANITPESGLDTLIDALARVRQRGGEVQLVVIGRGPHERQLRGAIESRGLQDRATVIDNVAAWDDALRGADVCVVPARQQELSLAPLLAMALAKTVIASSDQIAEWFVQDVTAWMFSPGSPVELADLLMRADSQRDQAAQLGQQARELVRERHKISRLTEETAEFYASVAYPQTTVPFRKTARPADKRV